MVKYNYNLNHRIGAASAFLTWLALDMFTSQKPSAVGAATGTNLSIYLPAPLQPLIINESNNLC